MAGLSFTSAAFTGLTAGFLNPRLVNDLGWSQTGASLLMVLASSPAVLAGLLAGGRAADLIGRRPTEVVAAVVGVAGGVTAFFSENGWAIGAGIFLAILGSSAFAPAFTSQRAELFPTRARAAAGAWMVNAGILGALGGFLAGHFVIGALGVPGMVAILGGVLLASMALLLLLPETRGAVLVEQDAAAPAAASPTATPA
jgi:MFS family permease